MNINNVIKIMAFISEKNLRRIIVCKILQNKTRIKIFLGEYGSGKTELAVNYAIAIKNQGLNTAIVDFDLVKPYFRARENQALLEQEGIMVVSPDKNFANTDLPIMPQNLIRILYDEQYQVIIDVGGSEAAVVLGQINQHIINNSYEALMVINTNRPFSDNVDNIIDSLRLIEQKSRLKISGLISNTNLGADTTIENILNKLKIIEDVSKKTGLPISFVAVPDWLKEKINIINYPIFALKPFTRYPWMEN
jgi:hypothetical protein